ncbi:flagellar basal body rod protein FlgB [Muricoccus radiodurans]|uniref:flagellar basal body rod protein FlgB n=1 Tax=Muricoccus radiodurans TaxID=2231721 RepID=UPI003CF76B86
MALAEARLNWLDRRQQVLARNIANADTPNFRPQDVTPFSQALGRASAAMARTDGAHLVSARNGLGARVGRATDVAPDGNAVSLDEQALKVAETDQAHSLAMGLHRRWIGLFRTALGRQG